MQKRSCHRFPIIELHRLGFSSRENHQHPGVHQSVIYESIRRYKDLGTEVDRSERETHGSVTTTSNFRKTRERNRSPGALAAPDVTRSGHEAGFDEKNLLQAGPWANAHFENRSWTSQQDGAPARKLRMAQNRCKVNFPDFISFDEMAVNFPDLNPTDYSAW
ncbi:hypothetical protein ANCCEY_13628 [Ancylostoma ceylanicum]|uniref:Uncharacterized protein n=1 Tax=Ancylostoma ceylanicum TaxID=53326 RepID=A0A0D6L752_9BILA|nr:hypothetical protein ANCCEY_13628 [Ancylostoma ceylanicum]